MNENLFVCGPKSTDFIYDSQNLDRNFCKKKVCMNFDVVVVVCTNVRQGMMLAKLATSSVSN